MHIPIQIIQPGTSMDKKPHQITPKITAFTTKLSETQNPLKRRFSATSPTGITSISKKLNVDKPAHSSSGPTMDESTTEVQSTCKVLFPVSLVVHIVGS